MFSEVYKSNDIQQLDPLFLAKALDPFTLRLQLQSPGVHLTELIEERREVVQAHLTLS